MMEWLILNPYHSFESILMHAQMPVVMVTMTTLTITLFLSQYLSFFPWNVLRSMSCCSRCLRFNSCSRDDFWGVGTSEESHKLC